jgi:IS30 family transposase
MKVGVVVARSVGFSRQVQVAFWRLIAEGVPATVAGPRVGVAAPTATRWFRQAGGVNPRLVSSSRLGIEDRELIMVRRSQGRSLRQIARELGRAPSTVSREVKRNSLARGDYLASRAERKAQRRAARPQQSKLAGNARLREEVQDRLKAKNSPEQIAHRLTMDFPDDPEMRVSHETIYKALYVQGRGALGRELSACLRTGRAVRQPRNRRANTGRGHLKDAVSISERPAEVEDRAVPGHWEGDLIEGSVVSRSAIGTLVERTTGFVMLLHLPDGHSAAHVEKAMVEKMSQLPVILRQTLTWDRGVEMANHAAIAAAASLDIYFCDPHSPWQRGSNENTNGLLRQYFPKGTDLSIYPGDYLDYVAAQLNNRPRKRHQWHTPAEKLDQLLSEHDVAFTA